MKDEDMFRSEDLPDPEKVELDWALEAVVNLYKGFRKHGLSIQEAAVITITMMSAGGGQSGNDLSK